MDPIDAQSLLARLLARLDREIAGAVALRRELHAAPELAHREHATAAAIARALPVDAETVAGTGRLARVGAAGPGAVAVRAELDGLPVVERTQAPFASANGAMHACGHDVHAAALVALARAAHALALAGELPAPLLAVFQPSEEAYPSGAEQLVADGSLDRAAPRAVVAAHVHPELEWRAMALDAGAVNASSDTVEIVVEGASAHGAYPHLGADPVLAIAQVVTALHAQVGRRIDPLAPAVVTVGRIAAGSAENVIPGEARAWASLRAHDERDRAALRTLAEEVVAGVATAHGCRGSVSLSPGEPVLRNDEGIVAAARALAPGAGLALAPPWRSCGADDFAFLGALAPLAMAFVGLVGAPGFDPRPLHHPAFLPPDEAVAAVARVQALLYVAAATG